MVVGCAAYADGRRVADVDLEAVRDWVAKDGHFVWIGLHEPTAEILEMLRHELGLHELAVEDAHRAHQRPKLETLGYADVRALPVDAPSPAPWPRLRALMTRRRSPDGRRSSAW
jgi:hypothetical protein